MVLELEKKHAPTVSCRSVGMRYAQTRTWFTVLTKQRAIVGSPRKKRHQKSLFSTPECKLIISFQSLRLLIKNAFGRSPNRFLKQVTGVVHVGANTGQERFLYRRYSLNVVWIEPIPEVFQRLEDNLRGFDNQIALQALVTDVDEQEYTFHISNNDGLSSSVFDLKKHKDIWPSVAYVTSIVLNSTTLATLLKTRSIDAGKYQALVMDTQGSELLVLRGCGPILQHFEFIKTEVPDFESYEGCCQLDDIQDFMANNGFREISRFKLLRYCLSKV